MNYLKFLAWQIYFAAFIVLVFSAGDIKWGTTNAAGLLLVLGITAMIISAAVATMKEGGRR